MKGFTLKEPYGTLVAIGAKCYETRGYPTSYRGWLAIHAGKDLEYMAQLVDELSAYKDHQATPSAFTVYTLDAFYKHKVIEVENPQLHLAYGSIIAVAKLTDCIKGEILLPGLSKQEQAFGFFHSDDEQRYGWKLEDVFRLPQPIPFRGQLGLWNVPPDVVIKIQKQWRQAKGA